MVYKLLTDGIMSSREVLEHLTEEVDSPEEKDDL